MAWSSGEVQQEQQPHRRLGSRPAGMSTGNLQAALPEASRVGNGEARTCPRVSPAVPSTRPSHRSLGDMLSWDKENRFALSLCRSRCWRANSSDSLRVPNSGGSARKGQGVRSVHQGTMCRSARGGWFNREELPCVWKADRASGVLNKVPKVTAALAVHSLAPE